ncbi:penicillin-binding protein 1C, partial [Escherichia coli]
RNRQQIPFLAPHLSEQLLASQAGNELNSTLNLPLQHLLERLVTGFIAERRSTGVENATAILIDSRDQSVKALVGSADYLST